MGSNIVNYVPWLQNLVRRSVMTMMTYTEVKGQQRSNVIIYGYHIWSDIPLIQGKDHDDLHKGHPKVIKGQIVNHAIWLSDFVRRTTESNWGQ